MSERIYNNPIELRRTAENYEVSTIVTGMLTAFCAYASIKLNIDIDPKLKDTPLPEVAAAGSGSSLGGMIVTAIKAASYHRRADVLETQIAPTEEQSQEIASQAP